MVKKVLLLAVLALTFQVAAFADSATFVNSGGILSGDSTGLTLSDSTLTAVAGFNGIGLAFGNLGDLSFTTGALQSGSLQAGGEFASGGSFTITGNGSNGLPNGIIFTGSFSSPVEWVLNQLTNGTHDYVLAGLINGVTNTGLAANGITFQFTVNTNKGYFNGWTRVYGGATTIQIADVAVPEPGSLSLMGASLLGLAGAICKKVKAQAAA